MAAPMWRGVVDEYISGLSDTAADNIVNELVNKRTTLLEVIESTGPSLTNSEASVRARAVRLLADIVNGVPKGFLSEKEVDTLVEFMVDKVKDHHSIQPHAIYGMWALSSFESLPDGATEKICRAVFVEVFNQSLAQGDRRNVYQMMLNFLNNRIAEIKKMESEFVHGFIQVMDMEKDPRNLVLAFSCIQVICHHLSLGVFVEEMFEVFSCYFPVDFTPPPGDVYGVRKEDLVLGIQRCMAGSPKFAKFCLPLLIEKMTSDLASAKIEAFNTLIVCSEVYGAAGLEEFIGSLFQAIKREVFSSGDMTVEDSALNGLTAIVRTLANTVSAKGSPASLDTFLQDHIKDCLSAFHEPGLRQFLPTARLVQSMAGSCDPAYFKVLHMVMPTFLEQFSLHTQTTHRLPVLNVIQNFVRLSSNFTYSTDVRNPLADYKESIFTITCQLLANFSPDLRLSGVTCLTAILSAGVLEEGDQNVMADHFTSAALNDTDPLVREACTKGLGTLGQKSPSVINNKVLPVLINKLQSEPMEVDNSSELTHQETLLQSLVSIATHDDIVVKVVPQLVSYIRQLGQGSCRSSDTVECLLTACKCLTTILGKNTNSTAVLQSYQSVTVPALIHLTVLTSLATSTESVLHQQTVLSEISKTIQLLSTNISPSDVTQLCEELLPLFLDGTLPSVLREQTNNSVQFQPLKVSSPWQQTQMICILMAAVSSIPKQVRLKQESELLERLKELSLCSGHDFTSHTSAIFLAALLNKATEGAELTTTLSHLKERLLTLLTSEINQSEKQRAMFTWIWLTKALVLRGHSLATDLTNQLLSWFENSDLGEQAANGFKIILSEGSEVMTPSQHANIRLMYKQRFFIENFPKLVEKFDSTQTEFKKHYLLALSHLVNEVPKQVLLTEINNLIPLLVHSLVCEDTNVQLSTLSTLSNVMSEVPDIVCKHVDSLLPQLLNISCTGHSMKSRISALKCVRLLCALPPHVILPHKGKVIRALEPALDDRKRLVRREAVHANGEWCLLGAPVKS